MPPITKLPHLIKTVSHETLLKPAEAASFAHQDAVELGVFRVLVAWTAYLVGSLTLQNIGLFLAIVFTLLQIVALLRREFGWFKPKEPK